MGSARIKTSDELAAVPSEAAAASAPPEVGAPSVNVLGAFDNRSPLRVLLVEDDEDDFLLTRDLLLESTDARFDIRWISNYDAALTAICSETFDVCLVDYHLGSHNGLEFIRAVAGRCGKTPLILLTGQTDHEVDLQALQAGAADYVSKRELSAALLSRSIRYAIGRARATEQLLASQEQLRQSQKLEAIGRLAGGVAHDFNNLLTAICGYSELLLDRMPADHPLRDDVGEIHKAAGRGASLTQQLLTFSRKQIVQPTTLDLNAVVTDLQKMLIRMIGENVRISTVAAADLKPVHADRNQLEQVLINLSINARDAMPAGGALIVKTQNVYLDGKSPVPPPHAGMTHGPYVALSVTDTGAGMSAETRSRIFEPFFTTKELGKGTGLGLCTVYGIVQQSNGHIHVDSELGRGSTFTIYLPAVEARPAPLEAVAPPKPPPTGSQTILLVEDQDVVRTLVSRVLRSFGYTVLSAPGGEAALNLCQQQKGNVQLLLTDVMMEGMNGRELAREVVGRWPKIKVMFISGYTSGELGNEAGNLEFDATFLQKPFTMEDLNQTVRATLEG